MQELLKGSPVSAAVADEIAGITSALKAKGVVPKTAVLMAGGSEDDKLYANSIKKRSEKYGMDCALIAFESSTTADLIAQTDKLNRDSTVSGVIMMRPFPEGIDDAQVRAALDPAKDIDGCTEGSLAGVFTGSGIGYSPCTAEAVMRLLDFYGIELKGRKVVVVGRSLVVGKPVSMMLLARHATVTICHSRTEDLASICRTADIIIAAAGKPGIINKDCLKDGQVIVDAGMNWSPEKNGFTGDLDITGAEDLDIRYSPVPGGLGAVTTGLLLLHTAKAAEKHYKL